MTHLSIFAVVAVLVGPYKKNHWPYRCPKTLPWCFLLAVQQFPVLIHLEVSVERGERMYLVSFFCVWTPSFPSTVYGRAWQAPATALLKAFPCLLSLVPPTPALLKVFLSLFKSPKLFSPLWVRGVLCVFVHLCVLERKTIPLPNQLTISNSSPRAPWGEGRALEIGSSYASICFLSEMFSLYSQSIIPQLVSPHSNLYGEKQTNWIWHRKKFKITKYRFLQVFFQHAKVTKATL